MCVHDPVVWVVFQRFVTLSGTFHAFAVLDVVSPFLKLLFQPVLFGYFACPFHMLISLIVGCPSLFSLFPSCLVIQYWSRAFLFFFSILATHCLLPFVYLILCWSISYPLYPFQVFVRSPHVQDNRTNRSLQLRIADSCSSLSMSRLNCFVFSFFFILFRLILSVATTGL